MAGRKFLVLEQAPCILDNCTLFPGFIPCAFPNRLSLFLEGDVFKQVFTFALCLAFVASVLSTDARAIELTNHPVEPRGVSQVRRLIENLGSGEDALVAVRLRDKSVVSGYVAQIERDSLVVVDPNTGAASTVDYTQIGRLQGLNVASGVEVHQGVGIRAKLARTVALIVPGQQVQKNNLSGHSKALLIGIVIGIILAIVLAKTL